MYLDGSAMLGQGKTTFGFGTFSAGPGGAVPLPGESMTYLYRNEVLDSVDALQVFAVPPWCPKCDAGAFCASSRPRLGGVGVSPSSPCSQPFVSLVLLGRKTLIV